MESLLECDICLEKYSYERKPMVLRCGHSFCAPCLRVILLTNGHLSCSICRAKMKMNNFPSVDQIPLNHKLDSLVTYMESSLGSKNVIEELRQNAENEIEKRIINSMKKEKPKIMKKIEKEIEKKIEMKISEGCVEETVKISRKLKVKLEKVNKEKVKRLETSIALMKEEENKLKELRKKSRSEVTRHRQDLKRLMLENKKLRLPKKRFNVRHHYRTRSSILTAEINPRDEINPDDIISTQNQELILLD